MIRGDRFLGGDSVPGRTAPKDYYLTNMNYAIMTSNDLTTRVYDYFATSALGPVTMPEIIANFADDPELGEMDASRASRKLRRVLSSLDEVVKLGDRRGAAYVFDPDAAKEKVNSSKLEETILLHHLFNGGRYYPESLHQQLDEEFSQTKVGDALNDLLQAGALRFEYPETVLDWEFWSYSGFLPRGTTSFTHTGTAKTAMVKLEHLLSEYAEKGESLPGTSIPAPNKPTRSMAIEAALVFTVNSLSRHQNRFLQHESNKT